MQVETAVTGTRQIRGGPAWVPALALLPAGTLLGHGFAYGALHGAESLPHAYLSPASWLAAALVLVSLGGFLRCGAEGARRRLPVSLLVAQPALFALQESIEHLVGDHGLAGAAASPAVRWGLGLQVLAAILVIALSQLAQVTGRTLHARRGRAVAATPTGATNRPVRSERCTSRLLPGASSQRGPPTSVVPA